MKTSNVFWGIVLLLTLGACEKDALQTFNSEQPKPVSFTSVVEGNVLTRAGGSSWAAGDRIGVYMKTAGESLEGAAVLGDNVPFITKGTAGNFNPDGTALCYPEGGAAVDFIAYYPYTASVDNYIYKVDVANQSNPEAIDLLYADNLTNRTSASVTGNLQFYHKLTRLVINFNSSDNTDFTSLTATLSGVTPKADFNLADGTLSADAAKGEVVMRRVGNAAEAILVPAATTAGVQVKLTLEGKTQTVALTDAKITELKGGTQYVFSVNVKNGGGSAEVPEMNYQHWTETPLITQEQLNDPDLQYVTHDMPSSNGLIDPGSKKPLRNYSMLYDKDLKIAYWVAYPLFSNATGSGRNDNWDYDPQIDRNFQADLSKGFGNEYDRGHQIPNADRNCTTATADATFYYSNMTPQVGKTMNQTIWADLETQVRGWMSGTDTLFVVTGAIPPKTNIQYQKGMAVPEYYFKALARKLGGKFYSIGFKLYNRSYSHRNYWEGVCSVADLEKETGFTFFPAMDVDKTVCDRSKWN